MSPLQMIRHLRISTSGKTVFIHRNAPRLFASVLILFAPTPWSISAAPTGRQQDRTNAVVQIRSILRAQQDAWNRGDIDAFMNGYERSRSTIFVSEDTVKRGWETVRARYRKKYSDRAKNGVAHFFRSRDSLARSRRGSCPGSLEIETRPRPATRKIHAHLQAFTGRMADCARSHLGGSAKMNVDL
jgi:hypothetical protein